MACLLEEGTTTRGGTVCRRPRDFVLFVVGAALFTFQTKKASAASDTCASDDELLNSAFVFVNFCYTGDDLAHHLRKIYKFDIVRIVT